MQIIESQKDNLFQVDYANSKILNIAILSKTSVNGRIYPPQVMKDALQEFEGKPSFVAHSDDITNRDVRDMIGNFTNIKFDNVTHQLKGDLTVLDTHKYILDVASKMPETCGFSVTIDAETKGEPTSDGVVTIAKINKVYSIDLVSIPASTKNMKESLNMEAQKLQEKLDNLEKINRESLQKIEILEKQVASYEKKEKVAKILHNLPEKAITKEFVDICERLNDEGLIASLVDERIKFYDKKLDEFEVIGKKHEGINLETAIQQELAF